MKKHGMAAPAGAKDGFRTSPDGAPFRATAPHRGARRAMAMLVLTATALVGLTTAPARADVKTGVDAWAQGDYAKAVQTWKPLAEAGDPDAQFNLGQAYKLGRGVPEDIPTALQWFRKAAVQGHQRAEDNYGLLLFQQGRRAEAMPYLQRSADRDEPRAQYLVGTALFNGDYLAKDWVRAYALMSRAATTGLAQARTALASMDQYIPEEQRRQGLAQAVRIAQANAATPPPVQRPAPTPIRTAAVPPSDLPSPPSSAPLPAPARAEAQKPDAAKPAPNKPTPPKPAPPKAAPAKPAPIKSEPTKSEPTSAWRVQFGAFSTRARAEQQWKRLGAKVKGLSAHQPHYETAGAVTRLQVRAPAGREQAERLCAAAKAAGADCLVKAP